MEIPSTIYSGFSPWNLCFSRDVHGFSIAIVDYCRLISHQNISCPKRNKQNQRCRSATLLAVRENNALEHVDLNIYSIRSWSYHYQNPSKSIKIELDPKVHPEQSNLVDPIVNPSSHYTNRLLAHPCWSRWFSPRPQRVRGQTRQDEARSLDGCRRGRADLWRNVQIDLAVMSK